MTVMHVCMCLYLFGSVFVRAVGMSRDVVHADVRLVFWVLAVAALWGLGAPVVAGWSPDAYSLLITLAICAVQHVTGRYWAGQVPEQFCRPECRPRARRATDQTINGGTA
ncbi:MAG: hypothetical protein ABFD96_07070 [Armatimonadia bacterium]